MKKIIIFLMAVCLSGSLFSQKYINQTEGQIILQSLYMFSQDSTEMWQKENVILNYNRNAGKMVIHDPDNFKVTTCYFNVPRDVCTSFHVVYYNLKRQTVCKILSKKYEYEYGDSWVTTIDGIDYEFCLREEPGRIFVIEACEYFAQN